MARPKTKQELELLSHKNFETLFELVESFSPQEQEEEFHFEDRDRNIRDVFIHLYEWHELLLVWISENIKGNKRDFLPEPYNWKTYPEMNIKFWEKHQTTPFKQSIRLLKNSHLETMKVISSFSDDELFTKKYFSWTGTTSL